MHPDAFKFERLRGARRHPIENKENKSQGTKVVNIVHLSHSSITRERTKNCTNEKMVWYCDADISIVFTYLLKQLHPRAWLASMTYVVMKLLTVMISTNSPVMTACRVLLYKMVNLLIMSPAFLDAFCLMLVISITRRRIHDTNIHGISASRLFASVTFSQSPEE